MPLLPRYTHIVNPKLKHIYLSLDEDGELVIKSPKVSQGQIEALLLKKASWITRSRQKFQAKKGKALNFAHNPVLYFKGQAYTLNLLRHEKKQSKLTFNDHTFTLFYHNYDESLFQKHIDRFYKEEAKSYIPKHVASWAETMQLSYRKISFRKTKRQWGSCSANNALSFNTMVMKLPENVIQYIIVHELSHITHKHHQKAFWQLVEQHLPEYRTQVEELKNYTT